MKFKLILTILIQVSFLNSYSQEVNEFKSKVSGKIYTNFNYKLGAEDKSTAFELQRAYFGYEKQLNEYFFANIKLDVGSPNDISEYSKLRRYAYFKNAGLTFKKNKLTIWGGLFDMQQFKVQEKFWGYRYLFKSYMDEYKFGPSADLGAGFAYKINKKISTDFILSNGEGYSSLQQDNTYKAGWGLSVRPIEALSLRAYYSIFLAQNPQMTISGFAGYRTSKFRIAAEYNYQMNYQFYPGHNRYGYSTYATYTLNNSWEIFFRYDQLFSNIVDDITIPWNLSEDGSALLGGIQYTPMKNIHLTADYQDWVEYAGNGNKEQKLFIHLEVNF